MEKHKHFFFLGIGGMGMAPLALYMAQQGCRVIGADDCLQPRMRRLLLDGGCEIIDSRDDLPSSVDEVVRSSGVMLGHRLLAQARERRLPVVLRGEFLAAIASGKRLVAVAGSHGKTTTTGMLIHSLGRAGMPCDYILGGLFADSDIPPAAFTDSSWLIAEIDESDGTIAHFSPEITVVVNLDWDHADHYPTEDAIFSEFRMLVQRTSRAALVPRTLQSALLDSQTGDGKTATVTFGSDGDYGGEILDSSGESVRVRLSGLFGDECEQIVRACGAFNGKNAIAAMAATHFLCGELPPNALSSFPGIHRRQTSLYADQSLRVYGDYAHHPTEIAALLQHWRSAFPAWRLSVVFQPHRYSRTKQFAHAFVEALKTADELFLMQTYGAGEHPVPGGSADDLAGLFEALHKPEILGDTEQSLDRLKGLLVSSEERRVIAFVGAGDIEKLADRFARAVGLRASQKLRKDWWSDLRATVSASTVLRENEEIGAKTTLRVGGRARYYAEPANVDDLCALMRMARGASVPIFSIGRGSNLIVADSGFPGLVIRLAGDSWKQIIRLDDGALDVAAGVRTKELCAFACRSGLSGFEFLEGIPGTVGGALRMNAGAMGSWMFNLVREVRLVNGEGILCRLAGDQCQAGYRSCAALRDAIAVGAVLAPIARQSPDEIRETIENFSDRRKKSQPRNPSAGCIFKNPVGDHAGRIIDELGLKGVRIGGAEISSIHGNFIVNRGNATSSDVLALVRRIRDEVSGRSGITLEPEVLLLGQSWEDVLQ